jgi:hypothetical protein
MPAGLVLLDEIVQRELQQFAIPEAIRVEFHPYTASPGKGNFAIVGELNGAAVTYKVDAHLGTRVQLERNGDRVLVERNATRVNRVEVNDRTYYHPESAFCDNADDLLVRPEIDEAIDFGERAFSAVRAYVNARVPGLLRLIERYYSRDLLPGDERPSIRTNASVFSQFDLDVRK